MKIKRYDERILSLLLDRYEGSLLYTGRNQVNVSIAVKLTKSVMPEYFDQTGTEYAVIDEELKALERDGLIRITWGRTNKHIIERCELNVEAADRAYARLKRVPKRDKEEGLKKLIAQLKALYKTADNAAASAITYEYLRSIEERVLAQKSVKSDVDMDKPEELRSICLLLSAIETNAEDCFLREFSLKVFHDTKTAEGYMPKALGIIRRFADKCGSMPAAADMSDDAVLEEFNIYRNPSWIMLKGSGHLKIGESKPELSFLPLGIGIAGADIDKVSFDADRPPHRVLTIENLTSFHRWKDKDSDTLAIYLGGYANKHRRSLIKHLYSIYPDAEYVHFGDIDCGGFYIWKALCEETGVHFTTIRMDIETYLANYTYGRALTDNDRRTLMRMKEDSFFAGQYELFDLMLEKGMKVEQEGIEL